MGCCSGSGRGLRPAVQAADVRLPLDESGVLEMIDDAGQPRRWRTSCSSRGRIRGRGLGSRWRLRRLGHARRGQGHAATDRGAERGLRRLVGLASRRGIASSSPRRASSREGRSSSSSSRRRARRRGGCHVSARRPHAARRMATAPARNTGPGTRSRVAPARLPSLHVGRGGALRTLTITASGRPLRPGCHLELVRQAPLRQYDGGAGTSSARFWEFIERDGSYAAPLALWFSLGHAESSEVAPCHRRGREHRVQNRDGASDISPPRTITVASS